MSTFYDFHNAIQQRNDYAEDQLRSGSPVVGVSCADGALLNPDVLPWADKDKDTTDTQPHCCCRS